MSWFFPGESTGVRRWRRRIQLPTVTALVLGVVDIWLLVIIGRQIGALPVVLFVIAEAALGGWVIRRRWRAAWRQLAGSGQGRLDAQQPVAQVVDTGLVVAGGAALIFPGLITALVGLLFLLPVTRRIPAGFLKRAIGRRVPGLDDLGGFPTPGDRRPPGYGEVIEGEVIDGDLGGSTDGAANGHTSDPGEPKVIRGEVNDH